MNRDSFTNPQNHTRTPTHLVSLRRDGGASVGHHREFVLLLARHAKLLGNVLRRDAHRDEAVDCRLVVLRGVAAAATVGETQTTSMHQLVLSKKSNQPASETGPALLQPRPNSRLRGRETPVMFRLLEWSMKE